MSVYAILTKETIYMDVPRAVTPIIGVRRRMAREPNAKAPISKSYVPSHFSPVR